MENPLESGTCSIGLQQPIKLTYARQLRTYTQVRITLGKRRPPQAIAWKIFTRWMLLQMKTNLSTLSPNLTYPMDALLYSILMFQVIVASIMQKVGLWDYVRHALEVSQVRHQKSCTSPAPKGPISQTRHWDSLTHYQGCFSYRSCMAIILGLAVSPVTTGMVGHKRTCGCFLLRYKKPWPVVFWKHEVWQSKLNQNTYRWGKYLTAGTFPLFQNFVIFVSWWF